MEYCCDYTYLYLLIADFLLYWRYWVFGGEGWGGDLSLEIGFLAGRVGGPIGLLVGGSAIP